MLISLGIALTISFATYSPADPSIVFMANLAQNIKNFFGIYGSKTSDFLLQSFGLISFLILVTINFLGYKTNLRKELKNIIFKFLFLTYI